MAESTLSSSKQVTCEPANTPVVLLCGGTSDERDISLMSGKGVEEALIKEGFPVITLDPADKGFLSAIEQASEEGAKVAFICLHGKGGEDGTMQGLCELIGLPYTGPGVLASALAMDKARAKICYRDADLPTPMSMTVKAEDKPDIDDLIAHVGEKCVVKPACDGSALGVTIVHDRSELAPALKTALDLDSQALVEQYVAGTEVTVAVLGNEDPIALPVIEIVPRNEFYDFDAKYAVGGAQHIIPARISDEQTRACQEYAIGAHRALGCTGVSRTDMIIDEGGTPWLLETNTIPGMTATSLLPDTAAKAGIPYEKLCHLLIDYALETAR